MTTETLTQPTQDNTTTTDEKKWNWDRDKQRDRIALTKNTFFLDVCGIAVEGSNDGASITDALRYTHNAIKAIQEDEGRETTPEQDVFLTMTRTDQRLVIRKILHNAYKAGTYTLVEATSVYRTGKKSGTKKYVIAE